MRSVTCKGGSKGSTGLRTGHNVSKEEKQMSFAFAFLGLKRRAWFIHSDSEKRALLVCKKNHTALPPLAFSPRGIVGAGNPDLHHSETEIEIDL